MLATKEWMERLYRNYNELIFHGEMPECKFDIDYNRDRLGNAHADFWRGESRTDNFCITLSDYYDSPEWVKRSIFLHEMLHIYDYSRPDFAKRARKVDCHGDSFFKPIQKMIETKYHLPCNVNSRYLRAVSAVNPDVVSGKVRYQVCVGLTETQKKYSIKPRIEWRKWGEEKEK